MIFKTQNNGFVAHSHLNDVWHLSSHTLTNLFKIPPLDIYYWCLDIILVSDQHSHIIDDN